MEQAFTSSLDREVSAATKWAFANFASDAAGQYELRNLPTLHPLPASAVASITWIGGGSGAGAVPVDVLSQGCPAGYGVDVSRDESSPSRCVACSQVSRLPLNLPLLNPSPTVRLLTPLL